MMFPIDMATTWRFLRHFMRHPWIFLSDEEAMLDLLDLSSDQCYMAHMSHVKQHMTLGRSALRVAFGCIACCSCLPMAFLFDAFMCTAGRGTIAEAKTSGRLQVSVLSIDESVDFVLGQMGQLNVHRFVVCTRSILHIR